MTKERGGHTPASASSPSARCSRWLCARRCSPMRARYERRGARMRWRMICRAVRSSMRSAPTCARTGDFAEVALPDGTTYFRREADVDSGRERQVLAFAYVRGRFVLATNERLLLRTLANIAGRAHRDRLADEPAFQTLSRELAPH